MLMFNMRVCAEKFEDLFQQEQQDILFCYLEVDLIRVMAVVAQVNDVAHGRLVHEYFLI